MAKFSNDKEYPKRPNAHPGRIDLIPQEFEDAIEDFGTRVRITPTAVCPNKSAIESTNHKLDCPICFGDEVLEFSKDCIEDWAVVQSLKLDKRFEVNGVFDIKDATITTRATVRLYYWYKIEILDFASVFNQLLKRGGGDTDKLRYEAAVAVCDTPYYLVDADGKTYIHGEHYRAEAGKSLRWLTVNRPALGKVYTLVYPVLPTFRVLEMMHENRYYYTSRKSPVKRPVNLPQQAVMRLDFLSKRSGSYELLGAT